MFTLDGKVALVTGATSGIGTAICRALRERGARVVLSGRRVERGEELASQLGADSCFVPADVSVEDDVRRLVQAAVQWGGTLDILVNNAGVLTRRVPITEESEKDYYRITDVNLKGVVLACKHALPVMAARRRGVICNVSSISAIRGVANTPLYCATKGAVSALTRSLAVRHGPEGIRVNAVLPGFVPTELNATVWQRWTEREWRERAAAYPLRRLGKPEDVAAAVVFLCSDEAGWITGAELIVDGGVSAL
ncbi:MAG: SDR family oxidoreductase [Armatimonadota bacterium]|nr:SDR family oxidoreductase [Armatimonadota bacterium]